MANIFGHKTFRVLGPTIIGIVLGINVSGLMLSGSFSPWNKFSDLPVRVQRLVTIWAGDLYVQAEGKVLYRCKADELTCRQTDEAPGEPLQLEHTTPCHSGSPEFSSHTNVPRQIAACLEYSTITFESYAYALDETGNLWLWNRNSNVVVLGLGLASLPLMALLGLVVGLVWSHSKNTQSAPFHTINPAHSSVQENVLMNQKKRPTIQPVAEVSERQAKLVPYIYVYVNDDGTARELSPSERAYLETPFHPLDGGRPYVKSSYGQKDGRGRLCGFCLRAHIPSNMVIADVPPEESSEGTK